MSAEVLKLPRKSEFRQRAHCNPLSDSFIAYPASPDHVDWSVHYPKYFPTDQEEKADAPAAAFNTTEHPMCYPAQPVASALNGSAPGAPRVSILDVGCGYGGLMMALAPKFPSALIMGMEIREKVTEYVGFKILSLRQAHRQKLPEAPSHDFENVTVVRSNVMKFMPNYFRKNQLDKIFFCFPDPHFKRSNNRRRIVTTALLSMYAYALRPGGLIYTVTDVHELHTWMREAQENHPRFEALDVDALRSEGDVCIEAMENETEEGKKVKRGGKPCWSTVFRRIF